MDEVCDIVQEAVIKTISKTKKCKKTKWLSEEALQIAVKRQKAKGKGEKERYDLFSLEEKEERGKEENNTMGKTRGLFKKIRDTKGNFMQRWAQ